jgi:hypothetical protein
MSNQQLMWLREQQKQQEELWMLLRLVSPA